jgi:hypothetical protein
VSTQALVSGLVLRMERDGHVPSTSELGAILGLGYSRAALRRAFVERAETAKVESFARALALLDALP